MVVLGATEDDLRRYKIMTREDLRSSTAMHNPNAPGLSTARLSWIWLFATGGERAMVGDECTDSIVFHLTQEKTLTFTAVWRVHWLRARAYAARWEEEHIFLSAEMRWVRNYFSKLSAQWEDRSTSPFSLDKPSHAAYALGQAAMWKSWVRIADATFQVNPEYREKVLGI